MATRKHIPRQVQAHVLIRCQRRCCLCHEWDGIHEQQPGQLAHIDRNASNSNEDNLVYLCLDHHNQYDRKDGLCKDVTPEELRHARDNLHVLLDRASNPRFLVTITVDGDFDDYPAEDIDALTELVKGVIRRRGELTIKARRRGSLLITLDLSAAETSRLFAALDAGHFDDSPLMDAYVEYVRVRGPDWAEQLRHAVACKDAEATAAAVAALLGRFGGKARSLISQLTPNWEPVLDRAVYRACDAVCSGQTPGAHDVEWFLQFAYVEAIAVMSSQARESPS